MNTKLVVALLSGLSIGLSISAYALADGESADYIDWSYVNGVEKKTVVQESVDAETDTKNIYNDPEYLDTDTFLETDIETVSETPLPRAEIPAAAVVPVANKTACAYSSCNRRTAQPIPTQQLAPVSIAQETVRHAQLDPRQLQNPIKVEYPITKQYPVSVEYPVTVQRAVTVQQPVVMQQPVIVKKPVVMQQEITVQRQPAFVQQYPVVMEQPTTYIQQQPVVVQSPASVGMTAPVVPMGATTQLVSTQHLCGPQPGYPCQPLQPAMMPAAQPMTTQVSMQRTGIEFLPYGQTPAMLMPQPVSVQRVPAPQSTTPVASSQPVVSTVQPLPQQVSAQPMGYTTQNTMPYYGY